MNFGFWILNFGWRLPAFGSRRPLCVFPAAVGLLAFCLLFTAHARAQLAQPGSSLFGRNDYVEYKVGNLPLILTSGHGGAMRPDEIANRTWGVTVADTNTRQLTLAIADEIHARTGRYPHVIINHLHRSKLDPNREIVEAAQGDPLAEIAWGEFHAFIEDAREAAAEEFGFGFLMDVHGHAHEIKRVELGYSMGAAQLNVSDETLEQPGRFWDTSLRTLLLSRPGKSFPELLRGPSSLGDLLNLQGIPAWPSPEFPSPGNAPFFSGGYITRRHGPTGDNGVINSVQAECFYVGLRDTAANRANSARIFADVFQKYFWDNYGYSLGTGPVYRLEATQTETQKGSPLLYFNVLRDGYFSGFSSIDLELGGTAVRGIDYRVSAQTITFPNGQTSRQHSIQPMGPTAASGDKTITIRLKPDATQAADLTPVVITLGDGVSQTVRVEAAAAEVSEGDGRVRFRFRRTETSSSVTVGLEWTGTARAGIDYRDGEKLPSFVTFAAGEEEAEVSLALIDDSIAEPRKEIVLRLLAGDGYLPGHASEATVVLHDDDAPDGLAVWYPGLVLNNRILDFSGNERHATTLPAGRGPVSVEAEKGAAISFDGTEDVAAIPKFALETKNGFAISFRIRLDSEDYGGEQHILSFGQPGDPGSLNINLVGSLLRTTAVNRDGTGMTLHAPGPWATGQWRHYALSVDAEGNLQIFVDGVLVNSSSGWTSPFDPNEIFWLGWRPVDGASSKQFAGEIQDFRIYERGLAEFELASLGSGRMNFETWRKVHGVPEGTGPEEDPDGDGRSLLLEYALGGLPLSGFGAPRYEGEVADGRAALRFLYQAEAGDLHWMVEAAGSLAGSAWEIIAERAPASANWLLAPGASLEERDGLVTVYDVDAAATFPRRFIRLRVLNTNG